ncbi:MAG: hypothetical protein Kow0031_07920 [Anaerolineae bacterium]
MALKSVDSQHFYINDRLIDMVWIKRHAGELVNAANYHEINRSLHWLTRLAQRLAEGSVAESDVAAEAAAKKRLANLGLHYYLD